MEAADPTESLGADDSERSDREHRRARAVAYLDLWERNMAFAALHGSLTSGPKRGRS